MLHNLRVPTSSRLYGAMSTFNLNKIVESLQSTKIKSRNDALNLLAGMAASKLRLHPKQFNALVNGLLKLIDIEKNVYVNNTSNPVISRLTIASSFLRDVVEEELKTPHRRPRYKQCQSIVTSIISCYFLSSGQTLEPCVVSFSQIIEKLLLEAFFTTHLTAEAWFRLYKFLVRAINVALDEETNSAANENLLCNLLKSVLLLIGDIGSLVSLTIYHDRAYFPLLNLIKRCLQTYDRRASPVLIGCFKLINKLVIILATEDVCLSRELIKHGFKCIMQFSSTSVESLFAQFTLFLNLDPVHLYFDVSKLPKLISMEDDSMDDDQRLINTSDQDIELQLYTVGMLIQELVVRSFSIVGNMSPNEIVVHENDAINWFNLPTLLFIGSNPSAWLFLNGLVKLINSYYKLKSHLTSSFLEPPDRNNRNSKSFTQSNVPSIKRQKLKDLRTKLWACDSPVLFFMSLTTNQNDSKSQLCGIQLLTIHCELFENIITSSRPAPNIETDSATSWNFNDSTLLDLNLVTSNDPNSRLLPSLNLMIRLLSESKMTFWVLLCCRVIMNKMELTAGQTNQTLTKRLHQMLKLLIPIIKESESSTVATSIVVKILQLQSDSEIHILIDDNFKSQLHNVIDLADLAGPSSIDSHALNFWQCLSRVFHGLSKSETLAFGINRWFTSKWLDNLINSDSGMKKYSQRPMPDPRVIRQLICWLNGMKLPKTKHPMSQPIWQSEYSAIYEEMVLHRDLQAFIAEQNTKLDIETSRDTSNVLSPFPTASGAVESICSQISETTVLVINSEASFEIMTDWVVSLSIILDVLFVDSCSGFDYLLNCLQESWQILLGRISSFDLASYIVRLILESQVSNEILIRSNFQLDSILFRLREYQNRERLLLNRIAQDGSDFDDFSSSGGEQVLSHHDRSFSRTPSEEPKVANTVDLFKFNVLYGGGCIEDQLRQLDSMEASAVLACVQFYTKFLKSRPVEFLKNNSFVRLIRAIGEGPLSNQSLDRCDQVISACSELIGLFLPVCLEKELKELANDCVDLFNYLSQCVQKGLFLTESKITNFWTLFLHISTLGTSLVPESRLLATFLEDFEDFSNSVKIGISESLNKVLTSLDLTGRMNIYKEIFIRFPNPQSSIERCATYCLFFSKLTKENQQLRMAALFNLIECTRFDFFKPFLKGAIQMISDFAGEDGPKQLFQSCKLEIIKCWWRYNHDIFEFPYDLFGFLDRNSFLSDNYREIVAVLIAIKPESNVDHFIVIGNIAKIKRSDIQSLVCDSLPLIVPLAYTSNGIRNSVYKSLTEVLNDYYKTYMRQKLPLTILETIRFTDLKSEKAVSNTLSFARNIKCFNSDELVETSLQTIVSPSSSLDLINALIAKYWVLEDGPYWTEQHIYFLIRQLGRTRNENKLLFLRALKYVLCLSNLTLSGFKLFELIVDVCFSWDSPALDKEIFVVLQLFDQECLFEENIQNSISTIFKILCKVCGGPSSDEKIKYIRAFDTCYSSRESKFGTSAVLIRAALNIFKLENVTISYSDFESFLIDPQLQSAIQSNYQIVIALLSSLLKFARKSKVKIPDKCLVKLFVRNGTKSANTDLTLWISEYLSQFYLWGLFEKHIDSIIDGEEFYPLNKNEFLEQIGRMDFFLDLLIDNARSSNYEHAAFVETILGSLLWKFESRKSDVQKFLNFERYYPVLRTYLAPLDFHSCILLNSSDNDLDVATVSLDFFIASFPSLLVESTSQNWMSQLLLSIVQEVATFTSMASLLASYILKIPESSGTLLPKLICFYITLTGTDGAVKIKNLIESYWRNFRRPYDFSSIEMFKDTILLARVGTKLGIEVFRKFYDSLNKSELYLIVKQGSFLKSALILFEDSIDGCLENANYRSQMSTIGSIYESLDENDLFEALPECSTIDSTLTLIAQLGSSADKVHYSSGQLDASIFLKGTSEQKQVTLSLIEDGLLGISKALGFNSENDSTCYEWAWKLNLWDIPVSQIPQKKHEIIYSYFKQLNVIPSLANEIYESSILLIMEQQKNVLGKGRSENEIKSFFKQIFESLAIIHCLQSVFDRKLVDVDKAAKDFNKLTLWFQNSDLEYFEDILKARQIAFKLLGDQIIDSTQDVVSVSSSRDLCLQGFANEVVRSTEMYRQNRQIQKMVSSTVLLDKFVRTSNFHNKNVQDDLIRVAKFQFAKTLWENGQTSVPVAMLEDLRNDGSIDFPFTCLCIDKALISATLAKWLAESRQSLGITILNQIIDPMKGSVSNIEDNLQRSEVFHLLAHFCEQQYKSRNLLDQLEDLTKRVKSKRNEIEEIKMHYGRTSVSSVEKKSVQKYYNSLKSQVNSEDCELQSLKIKREVFAANALKFYLDSLLVADEFSTDMDNFFSLFLELSHDNELQISILENLEKLPSSKPLSWCTQLLSRISNEDSPFQHSAQELILRICRDHPFHSLYYLISLLKHDEVAKDTSNSMMLARVEAAQKLKDRLASQNVDFNTTILLPIEKLSDQSILLSEYKGSKGRKLDLEKLKVGNYWMNELPAVPPPTLEIAVSATGYDEVPRMASVVSKVSIATSGLSLPKIATFILSNGHQHKMLLKHGTDDLRQDATMEQVFNKVNDIFVKDRETRKRRLKVRTYKAVPLGPKAGVIEFVLNSKALIEVIRPYHQKLDGLKSETARAQMKDCQTADLTERLKVYNGITSKIHPVLRHYFTDNFVSPDTWFQSRQIYTRGIAASSMVGHILGLGDRHCNNILLDEFTGEPIQIDLGVAFDQGKRLPIPETVPFRLTRDIVDGFGFMGTKGPFSKLCEHSFRVLRSNKERILAIVDVLRWDPLYSWSISPIRKKKLQDENGFQGIAPHEDGSEAGAALLTVVEKLNARGLSVEATVRELIQEATSAENLAVIYCGWCPFF